MKTIGTCKECKWWNGESGDYFGDCKCPKLKSKYADKDVDDAICISADIDNLIESGVMEDYHIGTDPDFGCVHFEIGNSRSLRN